MRRKLPTGRDTKKATALDDDVGNRIRARRLEMGLSQTALAEGIGVTFQQVQKYEKGTNRVGAGRLRQIAEILTIPPAFFFGDESMDDPEKGSTFELLGEAGAMRMLKAYKACPDELRAKIVSLVEGLAQIAAGYKRA